MGVNDLEKQKRQKPLISYEEERPKKRRLGPLRRSNVENDLENLSNTLESMSQQLDLLTKSSLEINTPLSSDEEIPEPEPEKPKKKKRQINPIPKQDRICEYCGTSETPMWRRGPSGKATLCNKCGVKWRAGRILTNQDGSILPPPSPTTLSKPIKSTKANPRKKNQITYAQKEHVAHVLTLGTLNADQLTHIVTMIRNSMPNLRDSTEEIELDIESLDPKLVGAMYRYVVETVGLKPMQ
ncbi:hypothetical protein HDV01_003949 [Terramyces sp. JEL0728]|nr:hypothetical protein HDV01_003949 [Terramyces sp. JEL0728]